MKKFYFKKDEVVSYDSAVDPFYGAPQIFKFSNPYQLISVPAEKVRVKGILYDPDRKLLWHSISRVTSIVNDELAPKYFLFIYEPDQIVGLKEKKSVAAVTRKVKELGENGTSYKYYRPSDELFISNDLFFKIFAYFKGELPSHTPKRNSNLKTPTIKGLQNILIDTILNLRVRGTTSKNNLVERDEILEQFSAFDNTFSKELANALTDDILAIVIEKDKIRNEFLVNRLTSLFDPVISSKRLEIDYYQSLNQIWESAFNITFRKLYNFATTHYCEGIDELIVMIYKINLIVVNRLYEETSKYLGRK